ncbi:ATP-binding cassette domain-containing protein [Virgibacillus sp. C22-A2]|uniref:ATP-binding cassette domain-containing protein n=1 Tax=Virgibacillus tibetensis TaxID=3042313 RepID=A0ABU6KBP3_9BACI|nr:ATP-binding cassette domain-containing protein [Virgibacillus sp. C22-A2]
MFKIENLKVANIIEIKELQIEDQSVTCIVGQSGSGKSTFLRLLNNLDTPDEGIIYYRNDDIRKSDPVELRRKVIMVPQAPVIFDGTVRDNLLIGLRFAEKPAVDDERLNNALKEMKLNKTLEANAADLSGGEKQRLALARVLLMDGDVFLLDEPSSALDDSTALLVIKTFVAYVKANQKSMVMITHDKQLGELVADKIIYMDRFSKTVAMKEHNDE